MRSITCPTIFLKLSWLLSRVVMCLCVRTHFPLPCVCLFLKKKCEIGCTCRIYLRGNIFSLTIYNFARSIIFFSLKLSHLLSHSICRFTLGPLPYKNTWKEKCRKLDEVFYVARHIVAFTFTYETYLVECNPYQVMVCIHCECVLTYISKDKV